MGGQALPTDEAIERADAAHLAQMATAARILSIKLGSMWPCGHWRTPETTHRIGSVVQCKLCRRRGLQRMLRNIEDRRKIERLLSGGCSSSLWPSWYSPPSIRSPATAKDIITMAAKALGYTYGEMLSVHRGRQISRARQTIYAILRHRGNSYPQIAKWMNRDHSSVVHGVNLFPEYAKRHPELQAVYDRFTEGGNG